jgi:hypothetical protein
VDDLHSTDAANFDLMNDVTVEVMYAPKHIVVVGLT